MDRIAVVGLGLMGASLAWALKGFRGAVIVGADASAEVCRRAAAGGAVAEAWTEAGAAIEGADLVIFCVYAHHIPGLVEANRSAFKPAAVVSDICGVKGSLYERLKGLIPRDLEYVGLHPMAGKEKDGFENADPAIYLNSGLIICPWPSTRPETVDLMRQLGAYIGAARTAVAEVGPHDELIAYTSDLMHLAAAGLCLDYDRRFDPAFAAGAFRDCTRVADINAEAWTELLMDNRAHAAAWLGKYIGGLERLRRALAEGDGAALHGLLALAGKNKREMLSL
ncbi:MAG: prephenate dehydrogenase [Candidatus Adiutrix sp.]|nr:prephenate dehydrogenase [Candidatus Adiutrix sp.]